MSEITNKTIMSRELCQAWKDTVCLMDRMNCANQYTEQSLKEEFKLQMLSSICIMLAAVAYLLDGSDVARDED